MVVVDGRLKVQGRPAGPVHAVVEVVVGCSVVVVVGCSSTRHRDPCGGVAVVVIGGRLKLQGRPAGPVHAVSEVVVGNGGSRLQ